MDIFELSPFVMACVPVALGLVEVAKQAGLPSKYAPIGSIIAGLLLIALTGITWPAIIAQGIIVGLMASGLWSGGKALITK